jgi:hypothetical protein
LLCGSGCSDDDSAPAVPTGGGKGDRSPTGGATGRRDAGSKPPEEDDEDAGSMTVSDGGLLGGGVVRGECTNIEPAAYMSDTTLGDFNTAIAKPTDFVVTRVLASWDPDCTHPAILIALSDGHCPDGAGHELRLYFDAASTRDGSIILGVNTILPEPSTPTDGDQPAIRVRYYRPSAIEPSGNWGSCSDAVGMINLRNDINVDNPGELQGSFDLELTACGIDTTGSQHLIGTFNVKNRRKLSDACPAMM